MKNSILLMLLLLMSTSCATMFGGSKYIARVETEPSTEIFVQKTSYGKGTAEILAKRNRPLSIELKSESGENVHKTYENKVRIGTGVLSFLTWGFAGPLLDLATGAIFKPDTDETGVVRLSTKKYLYQVKTSEK